MKQNYIKKYYLQFLSILVVTFIAIFLIFKANKDLSIITNISIIFLILSTTFIILEYIINLKKKDYFPLFALSNFYILVCYLGVNFFDKYEIFSPFERYKDDYPYSIEILFVLLNHFQL